MSNNCISIKKCTTTFLWVLNFGKVGELPHQFSKSNYYVDFFQKWSPTCNFWIFTKNFPYKIEGDFFIRISFENGRRFKKKIKWISFVEFYPRASLARAAFTLKLSLIPLSTFWKWKWKVKVKWSNFLVFNFFLFSDMLKGGS